MNGKAQIKIQQMAFMLLAVTLFIALVVVFLVVIRFSGLKESAMILEERNSMLMVNKIANSPEFACEDSFGKNKVNCVDGDKLMMLLQNNEKYMGFWGDSSIEVIKIFPKSKAGLCTLDNYPNCNIIRVNSENSEGFDTSNFVTLCRKEIEEGETYDKCEIAKINVRYS